MDRLIAAIGLPIGFLILILGFMIIYYAVQLPTHDTDRKRHGVWYGLACILGAYITLALSRMIP